MCCEPLGEGRLSHAVRAFEHEEFPQILHYFALPLERVVVPVRLMTPPRGPAVSAIAKAPAADCECESEMCRGPSCRELDLTAARPSSTIAGRPEDAQTTSKSRQDSP